MIIDILPVWVFFLVTAGLILVSAEFGFRLGRNVRGKTEEERESTVSSISGVILGLQAFMLAFTFGIVSDRYDAKKGLVREEANVIRTTLRRADFLPPAERARTELLLREYLEERIAFAQARDFGRVATTMESARRIHRQLWDIAVANGRNDNSDIASLFARSVNELENLHATRVGIGLNARIPTTIWVVLLSLLTLGMISLGYHTAIANSRRSRVAPVLAIAFSLVIALIAALDHPGDAIMPVSQQPLVNMLSEMNAPSL